ncbi:hypothetical protein TWF281_007675 [Arthrobotrys megalospora]
MGQAPSKIALLDLPIEMHYSILRDLDWIDHYPAAEALVEWYALLKRPCFVFTRQQPAHICLDCWAMVWDRESPDDCCMNQQTSGFPTTMHSLLGKGAIHVVFDNSSDPKLRIMPCEFFDVTLSCEFGIPPVSHPELFYDDPALKDDWSLGGEFFTPRVKTERQQLGFWYLKFDFYCNHCDIYQEYGSDDCPQEVVVPWGMIDTSLRNMVDTIYDTVAAAVLASGIPDVDIAHVEFLSIPPGSPTPKTKSKNETNEEIQPVTLEVWEAQFPALRQAYRQHNGYSLSQQNPDDEGFRAILAVEDAFMQQAMETWISRLRFEYLNNPGFENWAAGGYDEGADFLEELWEGLLPDLLNGIDLH